MTTSMTRRRVLGLAGATAAGAAGLALDRPLAEAAARAGLASPGGAARTQTFVTRPDLRPPFVTVRQFGEISRSRYIVLDAPYSAPGHGGAMILDFRGDLVWFGPSTPAGHKLNFNVQSFGGNPVLTWWQGRVVQGHGEGVVVIADSSYGVTHVLKAFNGVRADLHEFNITAQGTALISAYRRHFGVDLSSIGGPTSGCLLSGVFQEIDIATGNLLFEWDSYNPTSPPVPITESHMQLQSGQGTPALPFDYFHINSIDVDADGDFIVSGRHTWTIYKISKTDGSIVWRLNGNSSDFTMGPETNFYWQHHVRTHGHGQLTIFDNGASLHTAQEGQSRALILDVDATTMQATLAKAYTHPRENVLATAMGSAQTLPGGEMFVGWGDTRRFSQFRANGTLVLDGEVIGAASYRGLSKDWTGHPHGRPAAAARSRLDGATTVYASWNGATHVASWTVFAGSTSTSLARVAAKQRTGFETAITVSAPGPYFAVHALDASRRVIARSQAVTVA